MWTSNTSWQRYVDDDSWDVACMWCDALVDNAVEVCMWCDVLVANAVEGCITSDDDFKKAKAFLIVAISLALTFPFWRHWPVPVG